MRRDFSFSVKILWGLYSVALVPVVKQQYRYARRWLFVRSRVSRRAKRLRGRVSGLVGAAFS